MKKRYALITLAALLLGVAGTSAFFYFSDRILMAGETPAATEEKKEPEQAVPYQYPVFYRGIYLNHYTARTPERFNPLVDKAIKAHVNAFVIDVQPAPNGRIAIPKEHIDRLLKNGIHPIARVVAFQDGLKYWPIPDHYLQDKITISVEAAKLGFKEIQYDYIRFDDYNSVRHLTLQQKYDFITAFLTRARAEMRKYDVKIAADVFGRIPLNTQDAIGQNMEVFDKVVDFICPMAYPSHYTWSARLINDPYYTVHLTSSKARERAKEAQIVTWIQAFTMRIAGSGLSYDRYIEKQIQACHESGIRGYLMWNAPNDYTIPLQVMERYYSTNSLDNTVIKPIPGTTPATATR